jgi:hypothetical protein
MDKESGYPTSKQSTEGVENNSTIQMYLDFMSLSFHSKQQDSAPPSPTNSERNILKAPCTSEIGMYS